MSDDIYGHWILRRTEPDKWDVLNFGTGRLIMTEVTREYALEFITNLLTGALTESQRYGDTLSSQLAVAKAECRRLERLLDQNDIEY